MLKKKQAFYWDRMGTARRAKEMSVAVMLVRTFQKSSISKDSHVLGVEFAERPVMKMLMGLWTWKTHTTMMAPVVNNRHPRP